MKQTYILPVVLSVTIGGLLPVVTAAEETLNEIKVTAESNLEKTPNIERKNRKTLDTEMIRDTRDLVRYTTDVGISDNGRHLKGFSMRGVEGNRVGISIDGVSLPDSEENSLYSRYGNFNNSRISIDPELVHSIDLNRGSDSFNSGSGALGGNVNFRTLDPVDIVRPGKKFGALLKGGYASKNREWLKTVGFGYVGTQFDAILLYTQRDGHELKSNGGGPEYYFSRSQHPDPATHTYRSYLGKINYSITDSHRIGFALTGQKGNNYTDERSYTNAESLWREADDRNERINTNLYYLYTPVSDYLGLIKADFDYQMTELSAVNNKGVWPFNWETRQYGEKDLDEIYDRRIKTKFKRFTLQADSQTLPLWGGEHSFSSKLFISQRDFKNINHDRVGVGQHYDSVVSYTIQYPMRTTQLGLSLKDNTVWNSVFSSLLGLRYDYEKVEARDLNAPCGKSCTAEGKPAGATFKNLNGMLGLDAQLNDTWKIGYQLSTGYRVPTASELYFTFENPYGTWKSNPNLKAEKSINHSINIQANNDKGLLDITLYQTNYRDFLFERETVIRQLNPHYNECSYYCSEYYHTPVQQMVNVDSARIRGIEIKSSLNLDQISPLPQGFRLSANLGYSKGKLSSQNSLLSIQPLKIILGIEYEEPNEKWGVFGYLTYLGAKKAKDAKVIENVGTRFNGYTQNLVTYKYLNKSAYVFDLFGFYKPLENVTLRAGVYNLFDRQYHTWDALRGINANSTTNTVDRAGLGLQRYYAPGRNFAGSIEIKF